MVFSVEESDLCRLLVQFIAACGSLKACWYSLKFISKDIPNLPEAMGLTYLSTMYMLECCGLSSKRIDCDEWNFLPKKFQTFINANDVQKVTDVISAKLSMVEADDGKKVRKLFWFIRLGGVDLSKVRFAGYPTNAPRISGIEASRTSFHEALWSLGKQYQKVQQKSYTMFEKLHSNPASIKGLTLIKEEEGGLNHVPGLVVSDGSTIFRNVTEDAIPPTKFTCAANMMTSSPPPATSRNTSIVHSESILLTHIRVHLLPLLLEPDALNQMDDFFLKAVNETKVEQALLNIFGSIQEEKEKRLSTILRTNQLNLSPTTITNTSKFPKLRQYGIPLDDQRVHQALLRDLYLVNKRSSKAAGVLTNTLCTPLPSGEVRALVYVPQLKSYTKMVRRERESGWFSEIINAIGGGSFAGGRRGEGEGGRGEALQLVAVEQFGLFAIF